METFGIFSGVNQASNKGRATSPFSTTRTEKLKTEQAQKRADDAKKAAEAERWFGSKDYDAKMEAAWNKREAVSGQYAEKKQERYLLVQKMRLALQRGDKAEAYQLSGQIQNTEGKMSELNTAFDIGTSQMMDGSFNVAAGGTMTGSS